MRPRHLPVPSSDGVVAAAQAGDRSAFDRLAKSYRREILVHAYRLVGSSAEAEELTQETLLRAWQRIGTFEARGSFRGWLYRIATNVCLNAIEGREPRQLPADLTEPADPEMPLAPRATDREWVEPLAEEPAGPDPEQDAVRRENVSLAFVTALQRLTPGQRAALILCDVLEFRALEAAAILDTTLDGLNGLLHRARNTLQRSAEPSRRLPPGDPLTPQQRAILERFVAAWEAGSAEALSALLADDARLSMPPIPSWFLGRDAVVQFLASKQFADRTHGGFRLRPARANAQPAFAFYRRVDGGLRAHSFMVVTLHGAQVYEMVTFLDPALVSRFGFPALLDG